jgi:hypothetical protein
MYNVSIEQLAASLETEQVTLDIQDEEQVIKDLATKLEMLTNTRQDIRSINAVSRDQVKELVEECEMSLHEDCPLGSYTEMPSNTNLTVTLEGILDSTQEFLGKVWAKFIEILRKIFDYFRKLLDPILPFSKNYVKARDNLEILLATNDELERLAVTKAREDYLSKLGEDKQAYLTAEQDFEKAQAAFVEFWNGLTMDIVLAGPYQKARMSYAIAAEHAFGQIFTKMSALGAILKEPRDVTNPTVKQIVLDRLANIEKPIDLDTFHAAAGLVKEVHGMREKGTLRQYADLLHDHREFLATQAIEEKPDAALVARHFISKGNLPETVEFPVVKLLQEMNVFKKEIDALQECKPKDDPNGEIGAAYRAVAKSLLDEFMACQLILTDGVNDNRLLFKGLAIVSKRVYALMNLRMIEIRAEGDEEKLKQAEKEMSICKSRLKPFV